MKKLLFIILLLTATCFSASAQKFAIGTNILEWGNFGTPNVDLGLSVSQHISFFAGARYNPWEFDTENPHLVIQNKQQTYYAGIRLWPWYVYSGWWFGFKAQYQDFARSGVWRPALEVGKGVGGGFSTGYTLMLTEHFNMEFGAGVWGGKYLERTSYDCPKCLNIREEGPKPFVHIDFLSLSLYYIF